MGVYVVDIILAGKSEKSINEVMSALSEKFDIKDGNLSYFLRIKVEQCKNKIGLDNLYIQRVTLNLWNARLQACGYASEC